MTCCRHRSGSSAPAWRPTIPRSSRSPGSTRRPPALGLPLLRRRQLGAQVSPSELLERYQAVVYAVGTATDNRLGIPGEDRPGSYPATEFVAWYNGHPYFADHQFDLNGGRAVVIGNGNVAIDVARMLVLDPE